MKTLITAGIITSLLSFSVQSFEENSCQVEISNNLSDLLMAVKNTPKDTLLDGGVRKFCDDTWKVGAIEGGLYRKNPDCNQEKYAELACDIYGDEIVVEEELLKAINEDPKSIVVSDPWQLSRYPNSIVRKLGYLIKVTPSVYYRNKGVMNFKTEAEVVDFFEKAPNGYEANKSKIFDTSNLLPSFTTEEFLKESKEDINLKKIGLIKNVICSQYTILHLPKCVKSLTQLTNDMAPLAGIVDSDNYIEVMKNEAYAKGASKFALKIMEKIRTGKTDGDFLSDMINSFLETGLSKKEAEDHAWNLIGVYATRGPNTSDQLMTAQSIHTIYALDILSNAITYLDQLRLEKGQNPYSYPPEIKTTCGYGKPYHFWMNAFLSRKLGKKTGDPKAAMYAVYLSEIGYQMKSETDGRDPARAFMVHTLDSANNKLRIDVAFGAAGAVYGMKSAKGEAVKELSVDDALVSMIKNSRPSPMLDKENAESLWSGIGVKGYLKWKSMFNPDAALNSLLKDTKKR